MGPSGPFPRSKATSTKGGPGDGCPPSCFFVCYLFVTMHPFREPTLPKVAMKRDSLSVVVAIAGVVAVISASIPLGLEYYESHTLAVRVPHTPQAPEVVRHVAVPKKMLEASSANAMLASGREPPRLLVPFTSPNGEYFMMLGANSCIGRPLDHDPRGEPGVHCSKDAPHGFTCWNEHAPGGLRMAPAR